MSSPTRARSPGLPGLPGAMSNPATRAVPASGAKSPASMRRVVVLPAPLGPSSPNTSPRCTSNVMSLQADRPSNDLVSPLTSMAVT